MSTPATIPIFDPQGTLRDVPFEQMRDALSNGGKPALRFQAPDNKIRYVPADQTQDALKAGGKLLPIEQQSTGIPEMYGFTPSHLLSNAWQGVKSVASGAYDIGKDLVNNPNWIEGDTSTLHKFVEAPMEAQRAKAQQELEKPNSSMTASAGHELAGTIPLVGPWAASIGEQAGTGDVGGAAAKTAAQIFTPRVASKALDLAKTGALKTLLLGKTPAEAYQSALKPSTTIPPAKVEGMVQAGLQNEIPVSKAGAQKLSSLIDDLNDKLTSEIQTHPGRTINPNAVATRADQIKPTFANQVNAGEDLSAIEASKQQFLTEQGARAGVPPGAPQPTGLVDAQGKPTLSQGTPAVPAKPAPPMSAERAQAMKVGTYQQLKSKAYGELKSATEESQKALARGLKEELATAFPELHDLNQGLSKAYDLQPVLENAIQRQGNHQMMGLGAPAIGIGVKAATGSGVLASAASILKLVVDNPVVKSRLAIALNKAGVPWNSAQTRVAAYSAALAGAASGSNSATPDDRTTQQDQR